MCGIWAIINKEIEPFDYQSFCTLGCANDSRGGDSCGIFIDGKAEYGIDKKKYFEAFFWSSELLNNTKEALIALGHDRKASVGGITLEKAHPIIITEKDEEDHDVIKFVMIHNGTVHDYEALAKKYIPDIDIKGMSDSQVLARLLYYSGFDFLAEYNGGAAFVAVDYRGKEPLVLIWRGESKKFSTSTELEEERPLYCNLNNGRLVISSIPSYLHIVDGDCYVVPANKVLTYQNDKLIILQEIDRSKAQQNKKIEYNSYYGNYNGGGNVYRYLRCLPTDNIYMVGNDKADGVLRMTNFGRILNKYDSASSVEQQHIIFFFNGIALRDRKAYGFLCKAWKRTKMNLETFTATYQNLIRYFSIDQLYCSKDIMYQACTPFSRKEYSGWLQMLSETSCTRYVLGVKQQYDYRNNTIVESFKALSNVPDYDYKTIWKEFIQSME